MHSKYNEKYKISFILLSMHPQNGCDAYQKMVDDYKKFIQDGILLDWVLDSYTSFKSAYGLIGPFL